MYFQGDKVGINKDKTYEFLLARDGSKVYPHSQQEDNDTTSLISNQDRTPQLPPSILEPFFSAAQNIKLELNSLTPAFESLLKAQQECLRPTFADSTESILRINSSTQQINHQLQQIQQRIQKFQTYSSDHPDRAKIIHNLYQMLNDAYRTFSLKFKMAQQTFSTSYNRSASAAPSKSETTFSYTDFAFEDERGDNLQRNVMQQRENDEINQLTQKAEEVQQLFKDLAVLIADQGTIIDRIDYNIQEAKTNAEAAHEEIVEAEKYQKKSRMWVCAVIMGIMVFILLLMAIFK